MQRPLRLASKRVSDYTANIERELAVRNRSERKSARGCRFPLRYPDNAASIYLMKNSKSVVRFVSLMLSGANKGRVVVGYGRRQVAWFDSQAEADVFVASLGGMP